MWSHCPGGTDGSTSAGVQCPAVGAGSEGMPRAELSGGAQVLAAGEAAESRAIPFDSWVTLGEAGAGHALRFPAGPFRSVGILSVIVFFERPLCPTVIKTFSRRLFFSVFHD